METFYFTTMTVSTVYTVSSIHHVTRLLSRASSGSRKGLKVARMKLKFNAANLFTGVGRVWTRLSKDSVRALLKGITLGTPPPWLSHYVYSQRIPALFELQTRSRQAAAHRPWTQMLPWLKLKVAWSPRPSGSISANSLMLSTTPSGWPVNSIQKAWYRARLWTMLLPQWASRPPIRWDDCCASSRGLWQAIQTAFKSLYQS